MAGCPNRYMRRMMRNIYDQNQRLRIACPRADDGTTEEHVAILDALLEGDKEELERTLALHLEQSKERTIRSFR